MATQQGSVLSFFEELNECYCQLRCWSVSVTQVQRSILVGRCADADRAWERRAAKGFALLYEHAYVESDLASGVQDDLQPREAS